MSVWSFSIALFIFMAVSCGKDKRDPEDLPASVRQHLSISCFEGCRAYVQLVKYGENRYYYLGIKGALCDPNPTRIKYYDLNGNPIEYNSDLEKKLNLNGVLTDQIWNCIP